MAANTILTSIVTGGTNSHATVSEEVNAYATDFVTQGVVGTFGLNAGSAGTGSFCVNADAAPDMGVTILSGQAYIAATPSSQGAQVLRARASSNYTVYTINANASGSTKYDWIYLSVSAINANTPAADASNVTSIYTSRSSSNSSDNGTPPTYGLLLAVVTVANGASSITNGNISDRRVQASVSTAGTSNTTGWITGLATPNTVTALGNRSYSCVFNGTDLTGTISNGMRLKLTRLVAAPTQSTSLNGTTQYYSKTTPAGMTFTDNYTAMAWVKLSSYAQGGIITRFDGTNGWLFLVTSTGQIRIQGIGGGVSKSYDTAQSIPLNKWVHVAGTLNMAGSVPTLYIDGVLVPSLTASGAGASITQAGSLQVGAYNGTNFFPGKIAQAAVFSAVLSQSTIQSYYSQGLAGTEASLISAYSFNNSINDLNANANNLTANGSAVATATDSPFAQGATAGSLEYGIVTSNSFSTNTTLTVQVPEGCAIPTSGGVSAVSYSTQKVPYGFPNEVDKWTIECSMNFSTSAAATLATWYNTTFAKLVVPIGSFTLGYIGNMYAFAAGAATGNNTSNLSYTAANATPVTYKLTTATTTGTPGANTSYVMRVFAEDTITLSVAAAVYVNVYSDTSILALGWQGSAGITSSRALTIYARLSPL